MQELSVQGTLWALVFQAGNDAAAALQRVLTVPVLADSALAVMISLHPWPVAAVTLRTIE